MAPKVNDDWNDEDDWEDVPTPTSNPNSNVKTLEGYQPSTFSEGVFNSLVNGEALGAGLQGAKGFLKGATLNLPGNIVGGLSSLANAVAHPVDTISDMPETLANAGRGMMETTMQAGSHPEEFGEMMGELTGQPLVTAGLTRGIPAGTRIPGMGTSSGMRPGLGVATRAMGRPVEAIGNVMRDHQPVSGLAPRFADVRTARNIERFAGRKISELGGRMRNVAPPVLEGELLTEPAPTWKEGRFKERTDKRVARTEKPGSPASTRKAPETKPETKSLESGNRGLPPKKDPKLLETTEQRLLESPKQKLLNGQVELPESSIQRKLLKGITELPQSSLFKGIDLNNLDAWVQSVIDSVTHR